jgi:hypothetical protein
MSTDISVITEVSRKTPTLAHITNTMVQDGADSRNATPNGMRIALRVM